MDTSDEKKDTYAVPGEVAIALMAGRTEFLTVLENNVKSGQAIPQEQIIEMIRLCKDLIDERERNHHRIRGIEKLTDQLSDLNTGIITKTGEIDKLVEAIRRDRD